MKCEMPSTDVENCRSSTLQWIKKSFAPRQVLSAVEARDKDLENLMVSKSKWQIAEKVSSLLKVVASLTEHQSGSNYATLIVAGRILEKLKAA